MDVLVNVTNQKLKVATNLKTFVEGTQEFVRFVFNTNDKWNGLVMFAQFRQNGEAYNKYLDVNNAVYLPIEIVEGDCLLTLYGSNDHVIALTESLELKITKNYLLVNAESTEISTSLYDQLVTMIGNETLQTNAKTIKGAINELYQMINNSSYHID